MSSSPELPSPEKCLRPRERSPSPGSRMRVRGGGVHRGGSTEGREKQGPGSSRGRPRGKKQLKEVPITQHISFIDSILLMSLTDPV